MRHTGRLPGKQGVYPPGRSTPRRETWTAAASHTLLFWIPSPGECEWKWQVPLQPRLPEPPQASPSRLAPLQVGWRWAQGAPVSSVAVTAPPTHSPAHYFSKKVLLCMSHRIFLGLFITEVALP